jgi:hypothetical protein
MLTKASPASFTKCANALKASTPLALTPPPVPAKRLAAHGWSQTTARRAGSARPTCTQSVLRDACGWLWGGERSHVDGLGALLALGDVELDGLSLVQRATVLDGAGVDEHVVAVLGLDEAVALVGG